MATHASNSDPARPADGPGDPSPSELSPSGLSQSGLNASGLAGALLLAMPQTGSSDDGFHNSVVYICDHDREGALGFVINRAAELSFGGLCQALGIDPPTDPDRPVLAGGPVGRERGFILHDDPAWGDAVPAGPGTYLSLTRDSLLALAAGQGPARCLLLLGYAGWSSGQLDQELVGNFWLTCPADQDLLFDLPLGDRQHAAAARLGFDYRQLSAHAGHA
ncbi:MAG: YqgE/AlgH family protein [Gammaproteobacteria bacterium]